METIAERQVEPVQEFAAEQATAFLRASTDACRDIDEQVPDRCQIDYGTLRFEGHSRTVGLEPDRPAGIEQRPDLGETPP